MMSASTSRLWLIAPLTLSCVLLLVGCQRAAPTAPVALKPVRTQVATLGAGALPISAHGVIAYRDEVRLSFKVGGVIRTLGVDAGDSVHKGQELARIELTEVDSQLSQAREADERAARELARGERLYHDEVISQSQIEDLRTTRAVAAAQLRSAQFNTQHAVIVAPSDGVVLRRLAEANEVVAAGAPVLIVGGTDRGFVVRAALSDRDIVHVHVGDALQVSLDALPGQTLQAVVSERGHGANELGLYPIQASVQAPIVAGKAGIDSGMVARIALPVQAQPLVHVPLVAVLEGDGRRASVYVLDQGHAHRRQIQIAFIDSDSVALTSGVNAGEAVITDGAAWIDDNEAVALSP